MACAVKLGLVGSERHAARIAAILEQTALFIRVELCVIANGTNTPEHNRARRVVVHDGLLNRWTESAISAS